jgi:putative endonuclease
MKYVKDAIRREKEIKGWIRKKKEQLIESENPERFLNSDIMTRPPEKDAISSQHQSAFHSERSEESACAAGLEIRLLERVNHPH